MFFLKGIRYADPGRISNPMVAAVNTALTTDIGVQFKSCGFLLIAPMMSFSTRLPSNCRGRICSICPLYFPRRAISGFSTVACNS